MQIVQREVCADDAYALARQGVPALLARVYAARGVLRKDEIAGGLNDLLPYSALKGAEALARRLADAIVHGERILVVGDYDADGATATSIALLALREFGANVDFLIPDRHVHGYGLGPAVAELAASGPNPPRLLLTVDNGIASLPGVERARELGMEVLVTDHHLPAKYGGEVVLPAASVIVNPSQPGCNFSSKAIAGCGVIWYCMWALQDELLERGLLKPQTRSVDRLLPIVAVGTVADVVPLDLNNRTLIALGLARIHAACEFPGISALCEVAGVSTATLSTADIAFQVAPRVNAAGRLLSMRQGVQCLVADRDETARTLAVELNSINVERKDIEADIVQQALALLPGQEDIAGLALFQPEWHHGVIGIVAGRLKERLHRPVFVLAQDDEGQVKGSGRSIPGFHLRDALDLLDKEHPGLLVKFGGHAMAAGVTLRAGGVEEFKQAFDEIARRTLDPAVLTRTLLTDGALEPEELTESTVKMLRAGVWGQQFPEPCFDGVFDVLATKLIGQDKNHLQMQVSYRGRRCTALRFRHEGPIPQRGDRVRLVYKPALNQWQGETYLQVLVDHIEPA